MIRAAWLLLFLLAGQVRGVAAEPVRSVLDCKGWLTGTTLSHRGPTGDLLGIDLAEDGELATVPAGHLFTLQGNLGLLLRERKVSREREVRNQGSQMAWSYRRGSRWLGASFSYQDVLVRMRNVHTDDDFLLAERNTSSWRVGAGAEYGPWEIRAAAGRSLKGEFSAGVARDVAGTRLFLGAQLDRSRWIADQSFAQRRYVFQFPLRRETWLFTCLPSADRLPKFRAWRQLLVSESNEAGGDYNLLYRSGYGAEVFWRPGWKDAVLEASGFAGDLNLKMLADDKVYLQLDGARSRAGWIRMVTPAGPWGLRLSTGAEKFTLDADSGRFKSWPFVFWDVFDPDLMVLDRFHYRMEIVWLGLSRRFEFMNRDIVGKTGSTASTASLDLSVSHGWVRGGGDVYWRDRNWVLWPFVFDFDGNREDLSGLDGNLLRLQTNLAWQIASTWRVACRAEQLVPLVSKSSETGTGQVTPTKPDPEYNYGGLTLSLRLEWSGRETDIGLP